jgi:hypothetical protein
LSPLTQGDATVNLSCLHLMGFLVRIKKGIFYNHYFFAASENNVIAGQISPSENSNKNVIK